MKHAIMKACSLARPCVCKFHKLLLSYYCHAKFRALIEFLGKF